MLERELLEQVKEGKVEAFEYIYHKYYNFLCRFSMHFLHDKLMTEEVVDDVLFYLWDHREEINIDSLKGYLVKAVRNRSINAVKAAARNHESFFSYIATNEGVDFIDSLLLPNEESSPMGYLLQNELENVLRKAIENLPKECRTIFKMSRFEGKKYNEIALQLGISVNTVKYHTKNALRILSENISNYHILLFLLIYANQAIL